MKSPVNIKGTKSGIIVVMNNKLPFDEIKEAVRAKFESSSSFFGDAMVAIGFEGKELTDLEKYEIIDIISETTNLNIICIAEDDPKLEERMNQSLINKLNEHNHKTGQFYKGNLRNGQVMDFETSIIIIGNVYEGAQIVSKGNIIVLGELSGSAFAGAGGNPSSFVAALSMNPTQIRICDTIYKAPDKKKRFRKKYGTQIAVCENGVIYRKSITKDLIADIKLD